MKHSISLSVRLYRRLLVFYPAAFRQRFGEDMAQVFRDNCRDTFHQRGFGGILRLWLRILPDLALSALKERLIDSGYTGAKPMDTTTAFNGQLVSTFEFMSRALRSGYSVKQCLELIAKHAPEPTAGEIRHALEDLQNGADFDTVLTNFQTRLNSPYLSRLIEVMLRQRQEGGNLADKLDSALVEIRPQDGRDGWSDGVKLEE